MQEFGYLTLIDSRWEPSYQDYKNFCNMFDETIFPEDSRECQEWLEREKRDSYEADMQNLKFCLLKNRLFAITGQLELWNRKPEIIPQTKRGLYEAIQGCIGADIQKVKVEIDKQKKCIVVSAFHHDGTNHFYLWLLNKNGEKWVESTARRYEKIKLNNRWFTPVVSPKQIF